jgi:hypothetical protein
VAQRSEVEQGKLKIRTESSTPSAPERARGRARLRLLRELPEEVRRPGRVVDVEAVGNAQGKQRVIDAEAVGATQGKQRVVILAGREGHRRRLEALRVKGFGAQRAAWRARAAMGRKPAACVLLAGGGRWARQPRLEGTHPLHVPPSSTPSGPRPRPHLVAAAAAQAQHQVQRALLLDVVVGQRAAVLQLLAGEDQALLVRGDAWG